MTNAKTIAKARKSKVEVGGIIIGEVDRQELIVHKLIKVASQSKDENAEYKMKSGLLSSILTVIKVYPHRRYRILGEWHTHPKGRAKMSMTDTTATGQQLRLKGEWYNIIITANDIRAYKTTSKGTKEIKLTIT